MAYINRILTNNAVVVEVNGAEEIWCGKGIGFKKHKGELINISNVTQKFVVDLKNNNDIEKLIGELPLSYLKIANNIRYRVQNTLEGNFNDLFVINLADHMYGTVKRLKKGQQINNLLTYDIKNYYPKEFVIGKEAISILCRQYNVKIPDDEAGYIALHIVNSELDSNSVNDVYEITNLVQEVITIVKYFFSIIFDTKSIYYYRFLTHLKFFAYRLITKQLNADDCDDSLYNLIQNSYPADIECALKIKDFVKMNYNESISLDEVTYLAIHIHRIRTKAVISFKGGD